MKWASGYWAEWKKKSKGNGRASTVFFHTPHGPGKRWRHFLKTWKENILRACSLTLTCPPTRFPSVGDVLAAQRRVRRTHVRDWPFATLNFLQRPVFQCGKRNKSRMMYSSRMQNVSLASCTCGRAQNHRWKLSSVQLISMQQLAE